MNYDQIFMQVLNFKLTSIGMGIAPERDSIEAFCVALLGDNKEVIDMIMESEDLCVSVVEKEIEKARAEVENMSQEQINELMGVETEEEKNFPKAIKF